MSLDIGVFGARSIPSTYSGYETFLTTLLPHLSARGHDVTMYCRPSNGDQTGSYRGVRRVVLPAVPGKQFNTVSHGLLAALRARLAAHDVLLVVNVANALPCGLNTFTGQPVLLNTDGQEWLRGKWGKVARAYFRFSARTAKRSASGLIADCAAMADVYADEFDAPSTVIPYCFPTVDFEPDERVLTRHGIEHEGYYVIAGRLNPENNIDSVAAAYSRSSAPLPLLVLGTANYQSPVQTRLTHLARRDDRIRLAGHVHERRDFLTLLSSAAVYLHGHSVGGMNPSLVEAMGVSALVAALDTPFNRETLGDAGRYFAADCSDVVAVAETLRSLPADERRDLRRQAATLVRERFDLDDVADAYEELLYEGIAQPRRRGLHRPTLWSK